MKIIYLSIIVLGLAFSAFLVLDQNSEESKLAFAQNESITIINLASNNTPISGSEFSIVPNPFTGIDSYVIADDSPEDTELDKTGIITITGIKNMRYTITQVKAPEGYKSDPFSKIVDVDNSSDVVIFKNALNDSKNTNVSKIKDVMYTAKFVCGSVYGDEGPLRPGHYDSDISILNKKKFQVELLWNVVFNDGPSSHAILKKLNSEESTGITCEEIGNLVPEEMASDKITEGFVVIRVPIDSLQGFDNYSVVSNSNDVDPLEVQIFYTANALSTLPHEVIVEKISFYIIQDKSGKIPQEDYRKTLDVSLPSSLNNLSNTESKIKSILAEKYGLNNEDLENISIRIKDVSIG
ncbi:MAG: prealbumin-like fold domain-containing protein, partial [Nitrosopumilaceae archaeon]